MTLGLEPLIAASEAERCRLAVLDSYAEYALGRNLTTAEWLLLRATYRIAEQRHDHPPTIREVTDLLTNFAGGM